MDDVSTGWLVAFSVVAYLIALNAIYRTLDALGVGPNRTERRRAASWLALSVWALTFAIVFTVRSMT